MKWPIGHHDHRTGRAPGNAMATRRHLADELCLSSRLLDARMAPPVAARDEAPVRTHAGDGIQRSSGSRFF